MVRPMIFAQAILPEIPEMEELEKLKLENCLDFSFRTQLIHLAD